MRTWIAGIACLLLLSLVGIGTGMVRISYPRMIDNPVLSKPVGVARIAGNQIFLQDGRVIEVDGGRPRSGWDIREIEIDASSAEDGFVTLWGSKPRFVCGGTAAIRIPLIPHDVEGNERILVGFGAVVGGPEPGSTIGERPSF